MDWDNIGPLYASVVPDIGHLFDGHGGYDTILGRFRYRGESEAQIEAAIMETLLGFSYRLDEVCCADELALEN